MLDLEFAGKFERELMTVVMSGRELAERLKHEVRAGVKALRERGVTPTLATVLVGEDPSSRAYVRGKSRDCAEVGIRFILRELEASIREPELLELIHKLNSSEEVHGVMVQLPLPPHLDRRRVLAAVDPSKDVDGLHPANVGKLWLGAYDLERDLLPCTPKGILQLLEHHGVELSGKLAVIINRSDLVGKPLAKLLLDRDATVVVCHSKTQRLAELTRQADLLVSAVGRRPRFVVVEDMVKPGAVVVDVGLSRVGGKLVGDVDFERVKPKASYITPVPGGVGPMTRAAMLQNVLIATRLQVGE